MTTLDLLELRLHLNTEFPYITFYTEKYIFQICFRTYGYELFVIDIENSCNIKDIEYDKDFNVI